MEKRRKRKINPFTAAMFVVLALHSLSLILLFIWGVGASVKTDYDFRFNVFGIPKEWTFENFVLVWNNFGTQVRIGMEIKRFYIEGLLFNSFFYALSCAFVGTMSHCIMGYITAKFKFKISAVITTVVYVTMVLPIIGTLPSTLQVVDTLGIYDSWFGVWFMSAGFLGINFLIFQAAFKVIPSDFAEAAQMDGAGNFYVFTRIMFPLVFKTFSLIYLLAFIGYWNDYQSPLIFLPSKPTIAIGLYYFNSSRDGVMGSIPVKLAAAVVSLLPIAVIFAFFHKKLLGNLSMGGLKG
ncbi:MAG: carbohydrate ABC transporter permease [Clostridiales bacterium]|jgi:ABC-type glycerol-3-phosphate transport system permease component|nr:carbohydrate ABC transporter permease [Clostridiales bacterium]